MKGCIAKNPSPTLVRDTAKIEYIIEGQPSPYELAFRVELSPNPHSKTNQSKRISDLLNFDKKHTHRLILEHHRSQFSAQLPCLSSRLFVELFMNLLPDLIGMYASQTAQLNRLWERRLQPCEENLILLLPHFICWIFFSDFTISIRKKSQRNQRICNKMLKPVWFDHQFNLVMP